MVEMGNDSSELYSFNQDDGSFHEDLHLVSAKLIG